FASIWKGSSTTPPSGYSIYYFDSTQNSNISLPTGEEGQICFVINRSSNPIKIVSDPLPAEVAHGDFTLFMYFNNYWYQISI
ncbi:MAG: hypothetical protein KDC55_12205, partial [Ignavibacteriae bacterium]|nr:hypothetical protein [Ignavibacteriota bacterium]